MLIKKKAEASFPGNDLAPLSVCVLLAGRKRTSSSLSREILDAVLSLLRIVASLEERETVVKTSYYERITLGCKSDLYVLLPPWLENCVL